MGKKINQKNFLVQVDNSESELFDSLEQIKPEEQKTLSYIPSFFTTASLLSVEMDSLRFFCS